MGSIQGLASIRQDVRYAVRLLRRRPAITFAAVASLTLGIGVNTLAFSVVNGLLLSELPVERPEALVFVQAGGATHSYPNYRDLRDRNDTLAGLVGYRISPMSLETPRGASRAWGYLATGNYFEVLGVKAAAGRLFQSTDDGQPGASAVVVLSYDCWQARFAGDPGIVGRTIRLNRLPYTCLVSRRAGSTAPRFLPSRIRASMAMQAQIEVGNPWLERRNTFNTSVLGRLKPGVSPAAAEANLNAIAAALAREHPAANRGLTIRLTQPGLFGDTMRAPVRAFTLGVLGLALLVLLAACTNIASLMMAQAADRRRELALRASMGATRGRLVRQVLTETLVLSVCRRRGWRHRRGALVVDAERMAAAGRSAGAVRRARRPRVFGSRSASRCWLESVSACSPRGRPAGST